MSFPVTQVVWLSATAPPRPLTGLISRSASPRRRVLSEPVKKATESSSGDPIVQHLPGNIGQSEL